MSGDIVIRAEKLGKKYMIGHESQRERYTALRDVLALNARRMLLSAKNLLRGAPLIRGDTIEEFWALKDVSFDIKRGEVVGIIGRNGAGKSTLLKVLSRITEPSEGRVMIKGRVASLLEVGTGFHPELTGRENIYLNGAVLGMKRAEIKRKFDEIVAFAEVEQFLDTPVKRYSSGMYVRLAFAVAAHLEPDILLVDEVLAVGDAEFQKRCLGKMDEVSRKEGRTVLFVSHNMAAIQALSKRGVLLEKGRVEAIGTLDKVLEQYFEPKSVAFQNFDRDRCNVRTDECEIQDAWIEVGGERKFPILNWDQEFSFVIILDVYTDIRCSPEFVIRDVAGVPLLDAPTGLYGGFTHNMVAGRYQLKATCRGLRLASGMYFVDVAIADSGVRLLLRYESALRFEVPERGLGPNNWYYTQGNRQARVPLLLDPSVSRD